MALSFSLPSRLEIVILTLSSTSQNFDKLFFTNSLKYRSYFRSFIIFSLLRKSFSNVSMHRKTYKKLIMFRFLVQVLDNSVDLRKDTGD